MRPSHQSGRVSTVSPTIRCSADSFTASASASDDAGGPPFSPS